MKKKREEFQLKLKDLQSENSILINDLNKKEEEYSKLLEEKIELENNCVMSNLMNKKKNMMKFKKTYKI